MRLSFPLPPSLNNAFATVEIKGRQRRIISREYKAWKKEAGQKIAEQIADGWPKFGAHYGLHYRLNLNHQSDIGNREKCATDLLVAMGLVPGDQWCDRIVIERDRSVDALVVEVTQL